MARMLGRVSQPWCPKCKTAPGPDCPDVGGRSPREERHVERRTLEQEFAAAAVDWAEEIAFYADRAYVSRLWTEAWDCDEDLVYDD